MAKLHTCIRAKIDARSKIMNERPVSLFERECIIIILDINIINYTYGKDNSP